MKTSTIASSLAICGLFYLCSCAEEFSSEDKLNHQSNKILSKKNPSGNFIQNLLNNKKCKVKKQKCKKPVKQKLHCKRKPKVCRNPLCIFKKKCSHCKECVPTTRTSVAGKVNKENILEVRPPERNLIHAKTSFILLMRKKYYQKLPHIVKGTNGGRTLYEVLWALNIIASEKIKAENNVSEILNKVHNILKKLELVKSMHSSSDIWNVGIEDIDPVQLNIHKDPLKVKKTEKIKALNILFENIKSKISSKNKSKLREIETTIKNIDKIKGSKPRDPSYIQKMAYTMRFYFMLPLIFGRGIISPNKTWWRINDFLKDKSGVKGYQAGKNLFSKPIANIKVLGQDLNIVVDDAFAEQILKQSPDIFEAGGIKAKVFDKFMSKNVGISSNNNKEWYNRRQLNERVLWTDKLHTYAQDYNKTVKENLNKSGFPKNGPDFFPLAKKIVSYVIFRDENGIPNSVFDMFKEANDMRTFFFKNYKLKTSTMNSTLEYFNKNIDNPKPKSFIDDAKHNVDTLKHCPYQAKLQKQKNPVINKCQREEIIHQIPHWIFPMMKQLFATVPRILLMLANHPQIYDEVIEEIKKLNINDAKSIYNSKILRNCILEMLRLNSVTITTLRKSNKEYSFDINNKYKYPKGSQFLILNNPVLREPEKFDNPNKYVPSRWNKELEESYYTLMFGQGPQRCPGKEIGIFLGQCLLTYYLKHLIDNNLRLKANKIDTNYIEQMINYYEIEFSFEKE